jgi:radical SAM protein with 4Fe4S-binding SPASM domain
VSSPYFVGRKEYFGSLFYDFQRGDYIPFDWDATSIFEMISENSLDDISKKIGDRISKESFLTFIQLCQSIDLLNNESKLNGELLNFPPIKERISAPLRVHLQLTNKCELDCRHCSQDCRNIRDNELSLKEICQLIDQLAEIGTYELVIGGGDPFLRERDLLKVIKYASEKRISVSISTTGMFVGRVTAKKVSEYPIKGFKISFDGSTEKSFDYQRGKGSYRRAVRSIKTIRDLFDCPITLHSVLMQSNFTETLTLLKMVQKLKCNIWSVDFARSIGAAKGNKKILLDQEQVQETFKSIKKLQKYSSTPIVFRHFPYQSHGKRIYSGFGCSGGNLNCWIDAVGNVYPCSFLRENYIAGNIREQSFREIWIFSVNLQLFRSIIGNPTCKACRFGESCRGGCRARALESGKIENVDPACFIQIDEDV